MSNTVYVLNRPNLNLLGLREPLYALLGTGYLGYAAVRQWGKIKGVER